jgi:DNA-binding transcriptional MerR regulator
MYYKIGNVAEIFDLTREAIRSYEKAGILVPPRGNLAGYRYYHLRDLGILARSRIYKRYGFSLKEAAAMLHEDELSNVIKKFQKQEKAIEEEIIKQMNLLQSIRKRMRSMEEAERNLGNFSIEHSPEIYGIVYAAEEDLTESEKTRTILKKWFRKLPFISSGAYLTKEEAEAGKGIFNIFFCAEKAEMDFLQLPIDENIVHFESRLSVHGVITLEAEHINPLSLASALEYMRVNGLTLEGSVVCRTIAMIKTDRLIYDIWLPIS